MVNTHNLDFVQALGDILYLLGDFNCNKTQLSFC